MPGPFRAPASSRGWERGAGARGERARRPDEEPARQSEQSCAGSQHLREWIPSRQGEGNEPPPELRLPTACSAAVWRPERAAHRARRPDRGPRARWWGLPVVHRSGRFLRRLERTRHHHHHHRCERPAERRPARAEPDATAGAAADTDTDTVLSRTSRAGGEKAHRRLRLPARQKGRRRGARGVRLRRRNTRERMRRAGELHRRDRDPDRLPLRVQLIGAPITSR